MLVLSQPLLDPSKVAWEVMLMICLATFGSKKTRASSRNEMTTELGIYESRIA